MKKIQKTTIVLIAWGLFAVAYIVYDQVQDFKAGYLQKAYAKGREDTVGQLIQQAQKCDPFSVFVGKNEVKLINVDCLKNKAQQGGQIPQNNIAPQGGTEK